MASLLPVSWRLHREMILLAGWGRAILLQMAHPLVAQAVGHHSDFGAGPAAARRRLSRTVGAMLAMTFGPDHAAAGAARAINAVHDRVHGALTGPSGRYASGHRYSAHDPALLTWVHATLVDSHLRAYRLLVGPLSQEEADRYCAETSGAEEPLGIPPGRLPRSESALAAYLDAALAGGDIAVTDTARRLARDVLAPPLPPPLGALAGAAGRLVTAGLLPSGIRRDYGLRWSPARARALGAGAAAVRAALPLVPPVLRYWPSARRAIRRGAPAAARSAAH